MSTPGVLVTSFGHLQRSVLSAQKIEALQRSAYRHSSLFTPRALVTSFGRTLHSSLKTQRSF
ncbi:MAG: hypothetical protein JW682_05900 [Campylobacterales bacterium]|nr:hypothetical protein [Campylobacterales bacterium]HEO97900.1 hypothetical protein [Campylobacterota bacterium]